MTRIYIGNGRFVMGVPARDLTEDEWHALSDEQRAVAANIYRQPKASKGKRGTASDDESAPETEAETTEPTITQEPD